MSHIHHRCLHGKTENQQTQLLTIQKIIPLRKQSLPSNSSAFQSTNEPTQIIILELIKVIRNE